jgi:hypothetical protein
MSAIFITGKNSQCETSATKDRKMMKRFSAREKQVAGPLSFIALEIP